LSKLLANRLKALIPNLISQNQGAFVPDMKTKDNAVIANEIIHAQKSKKGKQGGMIIKIDLEKAFDSIKWDFILGVLRKFCFPPKWIKLLHFCFNSVSHNISINGGKTKRIFPPRGLR